MDEISIDPAGVQIVEPVARDGNVSESELRILSKLAQGRESLLEIGTFDGRTTVNLAIHCAPHGRVWTLDLPAGQTPVFTSHPADLNYIHAEKPPRWLKYQDAAMKITALAGDSASYDFGTLRFDFIFVDGCHAADCVRSDTYRMLSLILPGGICLWHDYGGCFRSVTGVLDDMARFLPMRRIEGTSLVVYQCRHNPDWNALASP